MKSLVIQVTNSNYNPQKLYTSSFSYPFPLGWISVKRDETDPKFANMWKGNQFFRRIEQNCMCLEERRKDMVKTNVDVQVLSTVPVMFNYWAKPADTTTVSMMLNDDLASQMREFRNRSEEERSNKSFYSFGTLPMQSPELAVEEMTRCCKDLGFKGIQIGSHINDWNLDHKDLHPIWKVIFSR